MKFRSPALILAVVAHGLAWAAWLWMGFWPYSYQGVSATPVQVDEFGSRIGTAESEVVRYSASFVEVNGIGPLLLLFIPVILTGLAVMALLTWKGKSIVRSLVLGGLSTVLLAFCALGYLSFGIIFFPAALASIAATIIIVLRPAARES